MLNPFELILAKLDSQSQQIAELKEAIAGKNSEDEVGTVKDAARWTKLSESTIYKLTAARKIPYAKRGGSNRYSKSKLDAWMLENQPKTEQQIRAEASTHTTKRSAR